MNALMFVLISGGEGGREGEEKIEILSHRPQHNNPFIHYKKGTGNNLDAIKNRARTFTMLHIEERKKKKSGKRGGETKKKKRTWESIDGA